MVESLPRAVFENLSKPRRVCRLGKLFFMDDPDSLLWAPPSSAVRDQRVSRSVFGGEFVRGAREDFTVGLEHNVFRAVR